MLRRTPMKRGTKPMARGTPMKAKRKARPKVGGVDYLGMCRGQPCYLMLPMVHTHPEDTVVPCHSNQGRHGKGMGIKASDKFTVPGCAACHAELDQGHRLTKEEKFAFWDAAYERWSKYREQNHN